MSISNVELTDNPIWVPAQSTVNGQPDDQTLDRACHQAAANRAAFLKQKLAAGLGTTRQLFNWISQKDYVGATWEFGANSSIGFRGEWILNSTSSVKLYFPLDFLPIGAAITGASARITPPTGHSGLPAELPQFGYGQIDDSDVGEGFYPIVASDLVAYEKIHVVSFPSVNIPVSNHGQYLVVEGERLTNALAGLRVSCVQITYTNPFA